MVFPQSTFSPSSYGLDFPPEHELPEIDLVEGQTNRKSEQAILLDEVAGPQKTIVDSRTANI
jgi:hypothetical protein